jgi:hypothetical protein
MLPSTTGLACPRTTSRKWHGSRSMFVNYLTIPNRGEINREFRDFGAFEECSLSKSRCATVTSGEIPYENYQGKNLE